MSESQLADKPACMPNPRRLEAVPRVVETGCHDLNWPVLRILGYRLSIWVASNDAVEELPEPVRKRVSILSLISDKLIGPYRTLRLLERGEGVDVRAVWCMVGFWGRIRGYGQEIRWIEGSVEPYCRHHRSPRRGTRAQVRRRRCDTAEVYSSSSRILIRLCTFLSRWEQRRYRFLLPPRSRFLAEACGFPRADGVAAAALLSFRKSAELQTAHSKLHASAVSSLSETGEPISPSPRFSLAGSILGGIYLGRFGHPPFLAWQQPSDRRGAQIPSSCKSWTMALSFAAGSSVACAGSSRTRLVPRWSARILECSHTYAQALGDLVTPRKHYRDRSRTTASFISIRILCSRSARVSASAVRTPRKVASKGLSALKHTKYI